ncbi:hypothetical protein [Arachnia propionica]|uniref:ScoMcrA-like SRA domain-containing protein n=1 Tax=Arachnia propionica TaxID=1750 RepID=A0A3P1WZA6_9ACTN|nr:hypothetical protein [Arachnia propionica]RRD51007.1 hypothetical protein EII35_02870 [Arachnia propionica]
MVEWTLKPGDITRRSEVAKRYGGGPQRGIEASNQTPNIMLYSDPEVGVEHGYQFDGWSPDGAFHYTGEGKSGDQQLTGGNRAIRDSTTSGRILRVFEAASGKQPGGKLQRYVGAFRLDPRAPYRVETVNHGREKRNVLVFRLLPLDVRPPTTRVNTPSGAGVVTELLGPESNDVRSFRERACQQGISTPEREETMRAWETRLRHQHHDVYRVKIVLPADKVMFLTDTYDATTQELFDVQRSSSRGAVRMGIGRLMDFRRHVQPRACSLLLPERPSDDLMDLVSHARIGLIVRQGNKWKRLIHP